ncbi:MAG: hypothetical protein P8X74_20710 [Reinekea sp.]
MNSLVCFRKLTKFAIPVLLSSVVFSGNVFANQCAGVLDAPVQSHGGQVSLSYGSVIEADVSVIPTEVLHQSNWSPACHGALCQASGTASTSLVLPNFITTSSSLALVQPFNASNLLINFANEFEHIQVGALSTVEFGGNDQFYAIKELTLEYDSSLILAPGDYWIESLQLGAYSKIKTKGGQVRLFVREPVVARYQASINQDSDADVLLIAWGSVNFDGNNVINASLYSADQLNVGFGSRLENVISASDVQLAGGVNVKGLPVAPDLLNGLCSDFGPLPDIDADGLADGLDPDDDNDGILNSQEGQGSHESEPEYGFVTVDDGTGNLVDTNQCTDAFRAGLQNFSADGFIKFRYSSQLLSSPDLMLPSTSVSVPVWTPQATCATGPCLASGSPADRLPERVWPPFSGTDDYQVPYNATASIDNRDDNRYKNLVLNAQSELRIDNQSGRFRAGNLQALYQAKLILTPGDYWFDSFQLNSNADLAVVGNGTARIYVRGDAHVGNNAVLNADSSSKLLLVINHNLDVSYQATVHAWVVAGGEVNVRGSVTGGIAAAGVTLGDFATVTYDYRALWQTDFSAHCDIDADGQYDLFDEDRDGDGITNGP